MWAKTRGRSHGPYRGWWGCRRSRRARTATAVRRPRSQQHGAWAAGHTERTPTAQRHRSGSRSHHTRHTARPADAGACQARAVRRPAGRARCGRDPWTTSGLPSPSTTELLWKRELHGHPSRSGLRMQEPMHVHPHSARSYGTGAAGTRWDEPFSERPRDDPTPGHRLGLRQGGAATSRGVTPAGPVSPRPRDLCPPNPRYRCSAHAGLPHQLRL